MKVSIIIPTYNRERYIGDAIDCVLSQTYNNIELIIVDDGSTDKTKSIVFSYKKKHKDIKYIFQKNQGVAAARNNGMKRAKGELIAFLDSDDLWLTDKLQIQVEFLKSHKKIDFLFTDMLESQDDRITSLSWLKQMPYYNRLKAQKDKVIDIVEFLYHKNCVPTSSVIIRKKILKTTGYFNETLRISEDREFWIRACSKVPSACITDSLVEKRDHSENLVKNVPLMIESRIRFLTEIDDPKGPFVPKIVKELKAIAFDETYYEFGRYYLKTLQFKHAYEWLSKCERQKSLKFFLIKTISNILKTIT